MGCPDFIEIRKSQTKKPNPNLLNNMVKNALEAGTGIVTIDCRQEDNKTRVSVHNAEVIPEKARFQLFQPSFSTKGTGRGFGTYSIKLLTERYLAGKVGFTSSEGDGTTFFIKIPNLSPEFL